MCLVLHLHRYIYIYTHAFTSLINMNLVKISTRFVMAFSICALFVCFVGWEIGYHDVWIRNLLICDPSFCVFFICLFDVRIMNIFLLSIFYLFLLILETVSAG